MTSRSTRPATALLVFACLCMVQPALCEPIWIEAETAASVTGADVKPSRSRADVISGGQWMTLSTESSNAPSGGVILTYQVQVGTPGAYDLWARVGFEWVRADLAVRLDDGEWRPMPASHPTANVVEIGVWAEIAWDRGPSLELSAGAHKLDLRFTKPAASDRFLFGLDCVALIPRGTAWTPDNTLKPGEAYDAAIDQQAANRITRLSAPAGPGIRTETPLDGTWQVARLDDPDMDVDTYEPIRSIPEDLHWRGVKVPADAWTERPDLSFAHTLVYRTKVEVPAAPAGRAFLLRFGGHAWITSVFVNGVFVESRQATLVPFDIDITRAVRTGQVNVIEVAIKGAYYAIDHAPGKLMRSRNQPRTDDFLKYLKWIDCTWPTGKGGGDAIKTGITRPVKLVVVGTAYTSDVFVRTTRRPMQLSADVEVTNATSAATDAVIESEAVLERTGAVEKRFPSKTVRVAAGGRATAQVGGAWPSAKLWWPAESATDKPYCYLLRTRIIVEGKVVDIHDTLFGFRELGLDGRHVTVNGVRWRPHAWNALASGGYGGTNVQEYFRWHDRGVRMEGGLHTDLYDRTGIPGRLSMCWEGMFGQVAMNNPRMWDNWKLHVEQMVKGYRNSPSIFHWSVGNEVQMITGRLFFGGEIGKHEKQMAEVYAVAKRLDSTRTVSEDGAGDLGGLADSNNWHYVTGDYKVPRQFYAYDIGPASAKREGVDFQTLYRWDGARPLVQGEEFYFAGMGNFAWFGGPQVYRGKQYRDAAGGRYGRMFHEGARWQDVFQINPCQGPLPGVHKALAAQAVFVREYNSVFRPGARVTRAIKVFNDTRSDADLQLRWRLVFGTSVAAQGTKPYALKAGHSREDTLVLTMPTVKTRADGRLLLELYRGKARVFDDTKPITVLPTLDVSTPRTGVLALYDPQSKLAAWLEARRYRAARVASLGAIPPDARVLVLGPNALTASDRETAAASLRAFVGRGNTAIVLEQTTPLREADLPVAGVMIADRDKGRAARPEWEKVGGHTGAICHPMALAHPVLKGLRAEDFFTWGGKDELNYRLSYATPQTGTVNLIQAGEDLSLAPMFELMVGRGSYLLCQMLVSEKLAAEPVAERLLQNALAWALGRGTAPPKRTVVLPGGDAAFDAYVRSLGIAAESADDVDALVRPNVDIAVVRATPETLKALTARVDAVRAMAERGGWIMLAGLDEAGLTSFSKLVGFQHRLRPFRKEGVLVEAPQDALMMGVSDRDLLQTDPEVIAPWMGLHRVSGKVFSSVVDAAPDIASFAGLSSFAEGSDRPLTDGLTVETFWRYTQYVAASGTEPIVFRLDRPETITAVELFQSDAYIWAKDIEISLDGKPVKKVTAKNQLGWQTFAVPPTPAREIQLRLMSTYPPTKQVGPQLVTIDEARIMRLLPAGFEKRVVPLTTPNGLVKYPIGKGGIMLNQVRFDSDDLPENLAKKRLLHSSLLRNLGCSFKE